MKTLKIIRGLLRDMTKHIFTKGNVTTTLVDMTEGLGTRSPAEILLLTEDGAIREYSEKLPDGRIITYSLEVEEEVLEEEEEIEINSSRKIGTLAAETPSGQVDTLTSIVEGEEILVNKTFSRTVSSDELGTSREVIQSSETEGGSSVSVQFTRDQAESDLKCKKDNHSHNATFVSDTGELVTEL